MWGRESWVIVALLLERILVALLGDAGDGGWRWYKVSLVSKDGSDGRLWENGVWPPSMAGHQSLEMKNHWRGEFCR